jgi:CheY-like chemotaxis protein
MQQSNARFQVSPHDVAGSGIGGLMVDAGWMSRADLAKAERHAQQNGLSLVDAVVALGLASEEDGYRLLARVAGAELVSLDEVPPSELAIKLVPEHLARQFHALPLRVDNRTLIFATCLPLDPQTSAEIGFASGRRAVAVVATRTSVRLALDRYYPGTRVIRKIGPVPAGEDPGASTRGQSRVLVCDDEPITRLIVKLMLEREGYEVIEASDGAEGVVAALRDKPDLTLMDLTMPVVDGYEAIKRIRGHHDQAAMPIIVLTADEGEGVERRVLELGADDYLLKPFDPPVLLARVGAAFRRPKLARAS